MPRKNVKWTPLMRARLGVLWAKGFRAKEIVGRMQGRYVGLPAGTVKEYLKNFSQTQSEQEIKKAYFKWKNSLLSPEQRRERALKAAKTKRSKLFEGLDYLIKLRELNLLTESERTIFFSKFLPLVGESISKFRKREDFGDIQQEADIACWIALSKWDKKNVFGQIG